MSVFRKSAQKVRFAIYCSVDCMYVRVCTCMNANYQQNGKIVLWVQTCMLCASCMYVCMCVGVSSWASLRVCSCALSVRCVSPRPHNFEYTHTHTGELSAYMSDKFHSSSTEVKGLNEKIQNLGGKSASGLYK